eukprot:PhM_4_TR2392/c0_g1_i1/m.49706
MQQFPNMMMPQQHMFSPSMPQQGAQQMVMTPNGPAMMPVPMMMAYPSSPVIMDPASMQMQMMYLQQQQQLQLQYQQHQHQQQQAMLMAAAAAQYGQGINSNNNTSASASNLPPLRPPRGNKKTTKPSEAQLLSSIEAFIEKRNKGGSVNFVHAQNCLRGEDKDTSFAVPEAVVNDALSECDGSWYRWAGSTPQLRLFRYSAEDIERLHIEHWTHEHEHRLCMLKDTDYEAVDAKAASIYYEDAARVHTLVAAWIDAEGSITVDEAKRRICDKIPRLATFSKSHFKDLLRRSPDYPIWIQCNIVTKRRPKTNNDDATHQQHDVDDAVVVDSAETSTATVYNDNDNAQQTPVNVEELPKAAEKETPVIAAAHAAKPRRMSIPSPAQRPMNMPSPAEAKIRAQAPPTSSPFDVDISLTSMGVDASLTSMFGEDFTKW